MWRNLALEKIRPAEYVEREPCSVFSCYFTFMSTIAFRFKTRDWYGITYVSDNFDEILLNSLQNFSSIADVKLHSCSFRNKIKKYEKLKNMT